MTGIQYNIAPSTLMSGFRRRQPKVVSRSAYQALRAAWICGDEARFCGCPEHFNQYSPQAQKELHKAWRMGWNGIALRVIPEFKNPVTYIRKSAKDRIKCLLRKAYYFLTWMGR